MSPTLQNAETIYKELRKLRALISKLPASQLFTETDTLLSVAETSLNRNLAVMRFREHPSHR
ncbi:hypothetical protein [Oryzicola mucosus]|uniref:Uncharacterized protein n=1 Tax=Oryzicola mucosus TaxID=2767425 RepID=A0A8J6U586_9HYPH|nr:hypothetical protein [Oryzicola mucosus]MBD0415750.1 hypothetical protein [Oryzicola mucosus]